MRKISIYISMSLDGYVGGENNSVAWLEGDNSEPEKLGSYPEFIETIDTVILGYTTYEQIVTELSPETWPYAGKKTYVLTNKDLEDKSEINFTSEDIEELLTRIKLEEGKNIWICGGASIVNQVIDLGLADEILISIIPTVLGKGKLLFNKKEKEVKLKLISSYSYNGITDLRYEVRK